MNDLRYDSLDDEADAVMQRALSKRLLPTAFDTEQIRAFISPQIRAGAVFSARTAQAGYLSTLREGIARVIRAGYDDDIANVRRELMRELERIGYDPERGGFPGSRGVPPAPRGSLQDLASYKRLTLILNTQIALHQGAALKAAGAEDAASFPAWELERYGWREVPRGSLNRDGRPVSVGWESRWKRAGGIVREGGRLVAAKDDPIWAALGNSADYDDALDVDHPPFAFNSGMNWTPISRDEWAALGGEPLTRQLPPPDTRRTVPRQKASTTDMPDDLRAAMLREMESETAGLNVREIATAEGKRFAELYLSTP